jgi:hypothetical protein
MTENLTVSGVVEFFGTSKFNKDDYSMRVAGYDDWFSQPKEWLDEQLTTDGQPKPRQGDTVSFYRGKKKDGTAGKYIRALVVNSSTAASAAAPTVGGEMNVAKDRMIVRQNALSHATALVTGMGKVVDLDESAGKVIETAKVFEAYAMGDLDALEAAEAAAKMSE